MKYFDNFPIITYNNKLARNIIVKASILREVISKYQVFHPYVIKDGERADTIAADYYGSSNYYWVVYLSNDIVDPYYQWPLSYNDFIKYLEKKYNKPIDDIMNDIDHYYYTGIGGNTDEKLTRVDWKTTPQTYAKMSILEKSGWSPKYVYDYENELNEKRRNIRLLDNEYLSQIDTELSKIFL